VKPRRIETETRLGAPGALNDLERAERPQQLSSAA
jgi:hypothetical protein